MRPAGRELSQRWLGRYGSSTPRLPKDIMWKLAIGWFPAKNLIWWQKATTFDAKFMPPSDHSPGKTNESGWQKSNTFKYHQTWGFTWIYYAFLATMENFTISDFVNIQYELYTYATLRLPSRSCSNGSQPLSFVEVLALVPGVSFSQLAQNVLHRSLRILGVAGTKNLEAYGGTVSQNMKTDGTGTPKQSCLSHLFRLMFTESYVSDSSYWILYCPQFAVRNTETWVAAPSSPLTSTK